MKNLLILCSFLLATSSDSSPATAQTSCTPRTGLVGHLAKKYGEAPVAIGVTTSGGMVEVFASDDGGTWTIILSNPNGISCLIAAGEGWRALPFDKEKLDPQT